MGKRVKGTGDARDAAGNGIDSLVYGLRDGAFNTRECEKVF
ncbi:hypothetical protein [Paraburkholderia sprentiae]|nr:hypothetical protein [Paraburkholderia sprentiae]